MLAVTFRVAEAAYAIRCEHVVAVIPLVALRPVAHGAAWVRGMFAYRGALTPVIDLCRLIGDYACPARLSSRIALVSCTLPEGGKRTIGLLAEHMTEARRVDVLRAAAPIASVPYFGEVLLEGSAPLQFLNVDALLPSTGPLLEGLSPPPPVSVGEKNRDPAQS
jgi:chemotaxis-related protein WspB